MQQDPDNNRLSLWHLLAGFGWGIIACLLISLLGGCKTIKYVPIETIKTERVEVHDTVHVDDTVKVIETDSTATTISTLLQKVDSAYLAHLGIVNAPPEAWLLQTTTDTHTAHATDTQATHSETATHATDSVRIEYRDRPYPVEKPLTRWQQFCLDYGKVTTGATIALILLLAVWLFRRKK